jgi:hypothetical protein
MKKILFLLALMLPLVLVSCGDDNDVLSPIEQDLVGEWAIIKTADTQNDIHYVFKKERTGSRRILVNGEVTNDIGFKWTLNGKTLTIDYGTGQQLVLEITMRINEMHVVYVATGSSEDYTRVVDADTDD